jgi:DNA polymerase I-like protein with 3'-5' exonuclease and polymerase domains
MTSFAIRSPRPRVIAAPSKLAILGPTIKKPYQDVAYFDWESGAIHSRPLYPPKPVSFALQRPGERKPTFYAFKHPEGNNCTQEKAYAIVKDLWKWALREGNSICMQHSKFDIDVTETHVGVQALPWDHVHDTEFLIFLNNPHAKTLALKPSAERLLGMKPEEQDAVRQWLIDHNIVTKKQKDWGAYISRVPAQIVGPYANGDVTRTKKIFELLMKDILDRRMGAAYNRERRLMPILLRTEREGVRVDERGMERDLPMYEAAMERVEQWLRKKLGVDDLDFNKKKDVANALDEAEVITDWVWTKGGKNAKPQKSTAKKNMPLTIFNDPQVASALGYRNRLQTCLSMFMRPWLAMARECKGRVHTEWSQVREDYGGGQSGARSGRIISSAPNLANISKDFEAKTDGYVHPKFLRELPRLPLMRKYMLPDKDGVWLHRDFQSQELRVMAHYENGPLMRAYKENPKLDIHEIVRQGIHRILGLLFERTRTKTFVFQNIYGGGLPAVTAALGCDVPTAKLVQNALMEVLPGYAKLNEACKARGPLPIITWGGRHYHEEAPAFNKKFGYVMSFAYRRLNYLIQPSSADITKETLIRYDEHPERKARFLVTVYDEINSSSPKGRLKQEMKILRDCMLSIELDVDMLSDGKAGKNWGTLEKFNDQHLKEIV